MKKSNRINNIELKYSDDNKLFVQNLDNILEYNLNKIIYLNL